MKKRLLKYRTRPTQYWKKIIKQLDKTDDNQEAQRAGKDYHNSNLMSFDMNNSDGKASLEQQKSPETTTDTQDVSKFYWFYA